MSARPNLLRRLVAEALGTFCLVFAGTGAVVVNAVAGSPLGHGGVAAAFGLVVAAMIFALGHLSGAHLNPAVTIAFCSARHFPPGEVGPYVGAQLVGALLASLALRGLFGLAGGLGATPPDHVGDIGALGAGGRVDRCADDRDPGCRQRRAGGGLRVAAIAIGATIGLEALVMGPITGASMNPARSLAQALVGSDLTGLWIYLVGPVVGALAGALIYQFLRDNREPVASPAAIGEPQEVR